MSLLHKPRLVSNIDVRYVYTIVLTLHWNDTRAYHGTFNGFLQAWALSDRLSYAGIARLIPLYNLTVAKASGQARPTKKKLETRRA